MHSPYGCFGSSLAHTPKSETCKSCTGFAECGAKVEARRPSLLKFLDNYPDGKGRTMAWAWLTPEERKVRRDKKRKQAKALAEELTFGEDMTEFKARLGQRAMQEFDKMVRARVDPRRAPLDDIARVTDRMGVIISALREKPQTSKGLTRIVAAKCDVSESTARTYVHTMTSILIAAERVKRTGRTLELQ